MHAHDTWLDHLSGRQAEADARREAGSARLARQYAQGLLVFGLVFLMVGLGPVATDEVGNSAEGGRARQVMFLALFALAAPLLLYAWRQALVILARVWAIALVFAVMTATVAWSAFPGVTVRRLVVYLIVIAFGLAIAAVLSRPRQYIPPLVIACAIVLFADLAFTVLDPVQSWDTIGLRALHPSKNVAGMTAQAMAIVFAATLVAVRRPLYVALCAWLTALALAFLALTISKTALALTVLCVVFVLPAFLAVARSGVLALVAGVALAGLVGAVVLATGTLRLGGPEWADLLTGDPTFSGRDDLWSAGLQHVRAHLGLGYGWGAQWSMYPTYHPLRTYVGFWTGNENDMRILTQSHNGYIDLVVHGGLLLFAAAMVFVVDTFAKIVAAVVRRPSDPWMVAGTALLAVLFISVLFSNLLESSLFFPDAFLGQLILLLVIAHTAWQLPEAPQTGRIAGSHHPAVRGWPERGKRVFTSRR